MKERGPFVKGPYFPSLSLFCDCFVEGVPLERNHSPREKKIQMRSIQAMIHFMAVWVSGLKAGRSMKWRKRKMESQRAARKTSWIGGMMKVL